MIFADMSAGTSSPKMHPPNGTRFYTFQDATAGVIERVCGTQWEQMRGMARQRAARAHHHPQHSGKMRETRQ
ncbi:liprin-alpha-2 isoform X4 [Tachysurus ichikawai]